MSAMIPDPERYFRELTPRRSDFLKALEAEGQKERIPIIGPVVGELLYLLTRIMGATRVLELGTATGYSALYFAEALSHTDGRLVTWEVSGEMARRAEASLASAGLTDHVEIRVGDAVSGIREMRGPFDLVFIDIEKQDYAAVLGDCHRLLRKNGLLVADNVGFADAAPFNHRIFASPQWRQIHLWSLLPNHSPEYDGLCLALRL